MKNKYYHFSYFKSVSAAAEKCLLVSDAMAYTADSEFLIDRKIFKNNLVMYVLEGLLWVEQYGKKYALEPGQGVMMRLTDAHKYYTDLEKTAHILWFHFRGAGTEQLLEQLYQERKLPFIFHDDGLEDDFYKAFAIVQEDTDKKESELAGHLYGMLMRILSTYSFQEGHMDNMPVEIQEIIRYMESRLCDHLDLDAISRQAGMGKYHFCRFFKKYCGIAPIEYYNSRRMELACCLLKDPQKKIEEISEQLGYLDISSFSKYFKNYFGISPSAYRRL